VKQIGTRLIISVSAALGLWAAAPAFADETLPAVQQQGDVHYITGGVGADEAKAVRAESVKYPLSLTFLLRNGTKDEFTSQVKVEITKGAGAPVFSATSDGPFMLIDLPPGKYRVTAVCNGRKKTQEVELHKGHHAGMTFEWPAQNEAG